VTTRIVLPWVTRTLRRCQASDAPRGESVQQGPLLSKPLGTSAVSLGEDVTEKLLVGLSVVEIAAAAQHEGLIDGLFESVMALLDISVLISFAGLDGLRLQVVVGQQGAVTLLNRSRSPRLFTAAVSRSVRWIRGTPPSSHKAFWSPWLRLSKLSEKQTVPVSQLE